MYRSFRSAYRTGRALKNHLLNLIDFPVIILLYHRVTKLPADPEMLAVSPDNFRSHMEFLKQQFQIVRLEEEWSNLKEKAIVITFDDGYADNVHEALPILEELGVPATFFVSTAHIGTGKEFWWHQLEGILLGEGEFAPRFILQDSRYGGDWGTETLEKRTLLYASLNTIMQRVSPERRENWLDQLRKWADSGDVGKDIHRSMSQKEIKKLAVSPWATIGAHTVSHTALSALAKEQQQKEIFASKQDLENMTGKEITTFSYPFGRKQDYDRASIRLCREAGFSKAAANFPGQVHRWTDPFQLPRHLIRNWDLDTFTAELQGFWTR